MSLSFFRSSSQGSPPTAGPAVRLVVERVEGATVVGWAATGEGTQPDIELLVDGRPLGTRVDPMHRQDVLDALQLPGSAPLGFRLHLPSDVWAAADGSARATQLRAGNQQTALPLPANVTGLVEAFRAGAMDGSDDRFVELAGHVRPLAALLPEALNEWLQAQVRFCGGWKAIEALARHPGAVLLGNVEQVEQGVIRGWAHLACLEQEAIGLTCNGKPLDCGVIRVERADVQQALNASRRHLGFEIELPSSLWQHASSNEVSLRVHVAGRPLASPPIVLRRGTVLAWLDRQREVEAAVIPPETVDQRRERQYTTLLLIEHVAAAGLWVDLDERRREFVQTEAQRYGIASLLAAETAAKPSAQAPAPVDDFATTTVWRLLRAFNARLSEDPAQPAKALAAVLASVPAGGGIAQRFLWSVIPYFCARGEYPALRPHLDAGRLRGLLASESAWELSLLVPEAVAGGDFRLAQRAMKKIAADAPGWLNTDCVAAAIDLASAHTDPARSQAVVSFVDAFLDLLEQWGNVGYWSRLHDANLIQALAGLLARGDNLHQAIAHRAERLALRCYALTPDFWRALEGVAPPVGGWSLGLQRAKSDFESVRRALTRPEAVDAGQLAALVAPLARLRSAQCVDVEIVARELALTLAARATPQGADLLLSGPNDLLRLAALPGLGGHGTELATGAELAEEIRRLADVTAAPQRPALDALIERYLAPRVEGWAAAPRDAQTMQALARRSHHFVGVRLACAAWLQGRTAAGDAHERDAGLMALREMWVEAFDACIDLPQPPAALITTCSQLSAALEGRPDPALERVVAEMRDRLRQRHGSGVAMSEASQCAAPQLGDPGPGHATLVAVYSCRRNLATRVQAIRDTWGRDLDTLGIPWVVVVGDGDGSLQGDVLTLDVSDAYEALPAKTLALVDWVWRHTRFEHLLKIDDDCHFAAFAYFSAAPYLAHHYHGRRLQRGIGGTDRVWHQGRSATERAAVSADKSPEPSTYADGGAAYALSRHAMAQIIQALGTTSGARLTRSAYLEDKLIGDLLALRDIALSNEGHYTLIRRRFGRGAMPVNAYDNLFYPSRRSPTLVTHLDGHEDLPAVQAAQAGDALRPARIWPTHGPVRLGGSGTNQLELLSPDERVRSLVQLPVLLVAVARNESVLAPHFLAHYRALGVRGFVLVDNLSDDGTREYLAAQPDVVLYSADTEYKHSHYGVSWQQAVLGAHALGKWVVLADLDEFLVYPDCEQQPIERWLQGLDAAGHDAARVMMVDMYPPGDLEAADFTQKAPFEAAPCFDSEPLLHWALGSGAYSNAPTYLSALRHRLIPDSAPNLYTSQKIAVFRYQPWVRLSEGLHYASNLQPAPEPVWFAHFKYHAGFRRKVHTEVARRQHFNGAEEYRKYAAMLAEARDSLFEPGVSATYAGSRTWLRSR